MVLPNACAQDIMFCCIFGMTSPSHGDVVSFWAGDTRPYASDSLLRTGRDTKRLCSVLKYLR
jgi:hypothetical protein